MLLVTFHGGKVTIKNPSPVNNVWAYDEANPSSPATQNILSAGSQTLEELRALTLANGFLYVVNGSKDNSNVLCFTPGTSVALQYSFKSVFIAGSSAISHPFSFTWTSASSSSQLWYVSNQDSNMVAVLNSSSPYTLASTEKGNASPYLLALQAALAEVKSPIAGNNYLAGTFVPTAVVVAEIPSQIVVAPDWGGLSCTLSTDDGLDNVADGQHGKPKPPKVQNSVRDVIVASGVLYVADEAGNAVRMYDLGTGVPLGLTVIPSPIHLAVQGGTLYVGSGDSVYSGALVTEPNPLPALPSADEFSSKNPPPPYPTAPSGYTGSVTLTLTDMNLGIPAGSAVSGITFDDSGNMYVALRKAQEIYQFTLSSSNDGRATSGTQNPLFSGLPDAPEFLLWMSDGSSSGSVAPKFGIHSE